MKRFLFAVAAVAAPLFSASAQAHLNFSGGSGNPLTMTLLAPVHYTITSVPNSNAPFFVFQETGDIFNFNSLVGTMTYSVNGAGAFNLTFLSSGFVSPTINAEDGYVWGTFSMLSIGDVVTLNAGMLTTVNDFAEAAPTSRAYFTYINDDLSNTRSDPGVSTVVPEPSTVAMMGLGLLALLGWRGRGRPTSSAQSVAVRASVAHHG